MITMRHMNQEEMSPFYGLLGEIEYSRFDLAKEEHLAWIKRKVDRLYYQGANFIGAYNEQHEIVGIISLLIDEPPVGINDGYKMCEVMQMGVSEHARHQGYGSQLLRFAEGYAKSQGVYCMYLHTYAGDYDVIAFYGKNGFIPTGMVPDVYGPHNDGMLFARKVIG